jgi:hypothetical protein
MPNLHGAWSTIYNRKDKIFHESLLTWDSVNFWTILSFPTLILRVDKANLSSPTSHPTNLATLYRPESKTIQAHVENMQAQAIENGGKEGINQEG